jgi:sensor domain CHASE-containing protein
LVWVRDFNDEQCANLATHLHSQVALWRKSAAPPDVAVTTRHIVDDTNVAGATMLTDALGQESILAQVVLPRRTWAAGMSTLWWQACSTVIALLVTGMGAL